jgi:hypothetical protein
MADQALIDAHRIIVGRREDVPLQHRKSMTVQFRTPGVASIWLHQRLHSRARPTIAKGRDRVALIIRDNIYSEIRQIAYSNADPRP